MNVMACELYISKDLLKTQIPNSFFISQIYKYPFSQFLIMAQFPNYFSALALSAANSNANISLIFIISFPTSSKIVGNSLWCLFDE